MSDNLSLSMRVTAHDDASPVLKKIAGEIDRLNDKLRKTVGDAKRAAFGSVANGPNQRKTTSTSDFARETADAAKALKAKFTGLNKIGIMARREAASTAREQAQADRAATKALRDKIAGASKVTALRIGAEKAVADEAAKTEKASVNAVREKLRAIASVEKLRAASERIASANAKAKADADAKVEKQGVNALKAKLATMARTARQRATETKALAREQARAADDAEKAEAASLRKRIAGDRWRFQLRDRMERKAAREREEDRDDFLRHARKTGSSTRDAASRFGHTGTLAATAMVGGTVAAARKGITVRGDVDAAETDLRTFGSEPASGKSSGSTMTQADVVKIRKGWLDRTAIDNGMSAAEAIRAYTEVRKAGIDENKARAVTEQLMASRAGMDMDLSEITSISGKVLTNRPNLDLKRWQNSFAIAAGTTAASPNQMVQGAKRAQGVLAATNMSPEDMNAYLATFIGAGVEPGKAGNFLAEQAITLQNAGNERGQRLKDLNQAARLTGFGSAKGLSASMTRDAAGTMELFYSNVAKLDERTRALVARRLGGKEWDDEILQGTNAVATLKKTRQAIHDPRNANYLDKAKSEKMNSWGGMWSRSVAVFKLGWEKFGAGFDELLRATNEFVDRIGNSADFDKITQMVRSALDGIKDGLGIKSWSEGLNALFGDMKYENFAGMLENIRAFFRGFVQGIRVFTDTIRSFASAILGGDVSAERLGKLTGGILAFAVGMFVVAPIVGVLASITSALVALGFAAAGAWKILQGMGLVGGAARAGAAAGAGGAGTAAAAAGGLAAKAKGIVGKAGKLFGVGALADLANEYGALKMPDGQGGVTRSVVEFLDPGLADRMFGPKPGDETKPAPLPTGPKGFTEKSFTDRILGLFGRSPAPETETKPAMPPTGKATPINDSLSLSGVRAWSDPPAKLKQDDADTKAKAQSVVPSIPAKPVAPDEAPRVPATLTLVPTDWHDRLRSILDSFLDRLANLIPGVRLNASPIRTSATGDVAEAARAMGARLQLAALGAGGSAVSGLGSSLSNIGGGGISGGGGGSLSYVSGGGSVAGSRLSNYAGGAYSPAPNSMAGQTFATKAPGIMKNLMADFALTKEQAAGVLGNLGHESAGMTAYQEGKPLGGGRGGAGWAQWTGPRRRAFEAWSARNGLDPRSDAANYGFLKHELTGSHAGALASLKRQSTVDGATIDFERTYEAAGVKHYGSRLGYARRAMGLDPNSATPNPAASSAGGNSPSSGAVDVASRYLGMHELRNRVELSSFLGQDPAGNANAWCASFVNASLKAVGQTGTGSGIANSFLRWGKAITADMAEKGDVLVEHRGRGVDGQGGHVGIATGRKRINPKTGRLELEAISGNSSDSVKAEWEDAAKLAVRRSTQAATGINRAVDKVGNAVETAKAIGDGMTSTGWRKASDASLVAPDAQRSTGTDNPVRALTEGAFRDRAKALASASPATAESLAKAAPTPEARGIVSNASRGVGGNGASITAPITIHHAGDSAQLANQVQRRIQEAGNWQSRDQDFQSV